MNEKQLLFDDDGRARLRKIMQAMFNSGFKDPANPPSSREIFESYRNRLRNIQDYYKPEAFNYSNPETMYKAHWQYYISSAAIQGLLNEKGKKHLDNTTKRRAAVRKMAKHLGHTPSSKDLKAAFQPPIEIDADICKIIDEDLENLLS